jgi:hypothetical protein
VQTQLFGRLGFAAVAAPMSRHSSPKVAARFDLSDKRVTTPSDMFWPMICATAVWTPVFGT